MVNATSGFGPNFFRSAGVAWSVTIDASERRSATMPSTAENRHVPRACGDSSGALWRTGRLFGVTSTPSIRAPTLMTVLSCRSNVDLFSDAS